MPAVKSEITDLEHELSKLPWIKPLSISDTRNACQEILLIRWRAFVNLERRRRTYIANDLKKALEQVQGGDFDLQWMPNDCWDYLGEEAPLTSEQVSKSLPLFTVQIEDGLQFVKQEALQTGESKGGPDAAYYVRYVAGRLSDVYRTYVSPRPTHTFNAHADEGDEIYSSDFDQFAFAVYDIIRPKDCARLTRAFADALAEVVNLEPPERWWLRKKLLKPKEKSLMAQVNKRT